MDFFFKKALHNINFLFKKVITSKTLHEQQINNVGQHKHGVIHISNCGNSESYSDKGSVK